jgi:hypothetical protein
MMAKKDKNVVGSASVDFLMYSGYITLSEHWLRMEVTAAKKMESGGSDAEFLDSKIKVWLCDYVFVTMCDCVVLLWVG